MLAMPMTVSEGVTGDARQSVDIFDPPDKEAGLWSWSTRAPSKPQPDLEEESFEEEAFDPEEEFARYVRAREAQEVAKPRRLRALGALSKSEVCDLSWRPIAPIARAPRERQAATSRGYIAQVDVTHH